MTEKAIHYRMLKKEDYSELADLIKKVWHYEDYASKWNAKQMAYVFLFESLSEHTFSQIALKNNKVIGVLTGNSVDVPPPPFSYKLRMVWHLVLLFLTSQGREIIQSFRRNEGVNSKLYKTTKQTFDGELNLFAVDPSVQGEGVGSSLYASYINYMKDKDAKSFYLYTDTTCTYSFYDKKQLNREAIISRHMPLYKKKVTFFLYTGKINQPQ